MEAVFGWEIFDAIGVDEVVAAVLVCVANEGDVGSSCLVGAFFEVFWRHEESQAP